MFRLDEVTLKEALWEQQQVHVIGTGLPRERFHACKGGLDVAKNLRRLACAYSHLAIALDAQPQ
ncbi:hypothetical protein D3C83_155080 [compost metagenome]